MNKLNEITRIDPKSLPYHKRWWALYSVGFYEKFLQKINDIDELKFAYNNQLRDKKMSGDAKEALTFFYRIRRDELNDPNFWNKVTENKIEDMKARLVKESMDEYMDNVQEDERAYALAYQEAKQMSREEGVAQHVNKIRDGVYKVEDWFDSDKTVTSFENGREL